MDDKVTLDRSTFKALASESRISILKSLDERRKTASELSAEMGTTVQAVAEHLNSLRNATLVERKESGRKWVYYELTEKGRAVLHPDTKKFWVLVALSLIAFTAAFYRPVSENFLAAPSPIQITAGDANTMAAAATASQPPQAAPASEPAPAAAGDASGGQNAGAAQIRAAQVEQVESSSSAPANKPALYESELAFLLAGAAMLTAAGWLKYSKKTA